MNSQLILKRQPVHVVYGGAQLFNSDTVSKVGTLALRSFETYASDKDEFAETFGISETGIASSVYDKVMTKLSSEPVEDYRIDFEDGFGYRTDSEEDETAISCAVATSEAIKDDRLPDYFGIRVKPFEEGLKERSLNTLRLYLREMISQTAGKLPSNFLITFPKVRTARQVEEIVSELSGIENSLGLEEGALRIEIMAETAESLAARDGRFALPLIAEAAKGRLEAVHFGAFDFTAELGIIAKYQTLKHQVCDFARNIMKISLEGTEIRLSDGATNIMPVGPNRGPELTEIQKSENRIVVRNAWKIHYDNIMHSLTNGYYQGWDLHPAQLVPRYAATYCFFEENLKESSARLKNFIEQAARSTLNANVFDDAASGQGLLNFFIRGFSCGAITKDEIIIAGITPEELQMRSFSAIISSRNNN